jgi:hypothetical protein
VVERGLAGTVGPPRLVVLDTRVRRDGEDGPCSGDQRRKERTGQPVRAEDVDGEHGREVVRRQVAQGTQRERPERARVVDEQVEAARTSQLGGEVGELVPVDGVGDVTGEADDVVTVAPKPGDGPGDVRVVAGRDDEVPAPDGERLCEGPAEALGGAGDECGGHRDSCGRRGRWPQRQT